MKPCSVLIICLLSFSLCAPALALDLYNGPEGVVYDTTGQRYLIACWNNATIVEVDSNGQQSYYKTGLPQQVSGLRIVGDTLWGAGSHAILGIDLASAMVVVNVPVLGSNLLNAIVSDTSGYLYVSDGSPNRIYRMSLSDYSYTAYISNHPDVPFPIGLLFEEETNRLLVTIRVGENGAIAAVDLTDGSVERVLTTDYTHFGYLTEDNEGNYYTTCHGPGAVFRYDHDFSEPPLVFASGYDLPTQIFYHKSELTLVVPDYGASIVDFLPDLYNMDSDNDGIADAYDNCPYIINEWQEDADSDGVGDICDNCLNTPNPDQSDNDSDGLGDMCDDDDDEDAVPDSIDNCQFVENPEQLDDDVDGRGNLCDNCPLVDNYYQYDEDGDGQGDACEEEGTYIQCCLDMPQPYVDQPYSYQLWAVGGTPPYTWGRMSGQLPPGLVLSSDGLISGTPTSEDTTSFLVRVEDQIGSIDQQWISMTVEILPPPPYICGDSDGSGGIDIDDAVYLIAFIFSGGPAPDPLEAGDPDCSGDVDIDDVVYLITYIFAAGNAPCDMDGDDVPDC